MDLCVLPAAAARPNASCSGAATTARRRASTRCLPSVSPVRPAEGRREVTIEWNGVDELTPLALGVSRALGVDLPQPCAAAPARASLRDVLIPAVALAGPHRRRPIPRARAGSCRRRQWSTSIRSVGGRSQGQARTRPGTARGLRRQRSAGALAGDAGAVGREGETMARQVADRLAAARLPVDKGWPRTPGRSSLDARRGLDRNAMRWGCGGARGRAGLGAARARRSRSDAARVGSSVRSFIAATTAAS